jgi:hypothetical protein
MLDNLVYVHIGDNFPEYIYDSLYQTLLVSHNINIYVLTNKKYISQIREKISNFNLDLYLTHGWRNAIQIIPIEIIPYPEKYETYFNSVSSSLKEFRNNFWLHTTSRFFYLYEFIKAFELTNVFHIENDVMLYENLSKLRENVVDKNSLYVVKDNPQRVVPSIIYIPIDYTLNDFIEFVLNNRVNDTFSNDMELLGSYPNVVNFPFKIEDSSTYIFDGAAIGQYLGGIDPKNTSMYNNGKNEVIIYDNPTKGFINETSEFKPDEAKYIDKDMIIENVSKSLRFPYLLKGYSNNSFTLKQIANLHIHSKQLYQFSSICNLKYQDIITGDRILSLCDYVLCVPEIFQFHKNMVKFIDVRRIIIARNIKAVDKDELNTYLKSMPTKRAGHIHLFIYTHMLDLFIEHVLDLLDPTIKYTLFLHNSDHAFGHTPLHEKLLETKHIHHVFAQNCDANIKYIDKITLLPIGLANSMWKHGDVLSLYKTISKSYNHSKTKNLYVNINPATYHYRKDVLDHLTQSKKFNVEHTPKPFNEYLQELSEYRFSLCVRGNGLDTHRFWESIYMGVIPVIIHNKTTCMSNFVAYLKKLNVPFYEIKEDSLDDITAKYSDSFFDQILYEKIIKKIDKPIGNTDSLRLDYYSHQK